MSHEETAETLRDQIFNAVVKKLGGDAIMLGVLKETRLEQSRGHDGVTFGNADHTVSVTTDQRGLSFKYYGWGPYILTFEEVGQRLEPQAGGTVPTEA